MKAPIHDWDARRKLALPGDERATLTFCADHFVLACQKRIEEQGSFKVALSGGSTPKALFTLLTRSPYVSKIDWPKVHLFWSDERSVGPEDPESNYKMAMDAGFATVGIPLSQIHRMKAEAGIEAEADLYDALLRRELGNKGFDYLMLGMGEDGHTASLFPGTLALAVKDRLVVKNDVPQKKTVRMTLTFDCINNAKNIVIYVMGEKKKNLVKEIFLNRKSTYPVEEVGTEEHPAIWILDDAAAELLPDPVKGTQR